MVAASPLQVMEPFSCYRRSLSSSRAPEVFPVASFVGITHVFGGGVLETRPLFSTGIADGAVDWALIQSETVFMSSDSVVTLVARLDGIAFLVC